ncbi:MAG: hypothetical protein HOP23_07370 [Methylococcaceae bacterium]|nr:hypothetical protein [Methylococcaceae bacterium]
MRQLLKGRCFRLEEPRVVGSRASRNSGVSGDGFLLDSQSGDWQHDSVLPIKIKTHLRKPKHF